MVDQKMPWNGFSETISGYEIPNFEWLLRMCICCVLSSMKKITSVPIFRIDSAGIILVMNL